MKGAMIFLKTPNGKKLRGWNFLLCVIYPGEKQKKLLRNSFILPMKPNNFLIV
jgi:hypothetical protein